MNKFLNIANIAGLGLKKEDYHAPVPRALEIVVGVVLGLISLGLVFTGLVLGYLIATGAKVETAVIWVSIGFLVVGVIIGRIAVRLLTGRGKHGGSALFSPNTIRLFGLMWIVVPVVESIKRPLELLTLVGSFTITTSCFVLAARRDRQKRLADSEPPTASGGQGTFLKKGSLDPPKTFDKCSKNL